MNLKQKIRKLSDNKYFKTPKIEKLLKVLMFVAVYEETNIEIISNYINMSPQLIKKYLSDKDLIMTILTEEEYKELITKVKNIQLVSEQEKQIEKIKLVSRIIDDIMNTRYRLDEIARRNFLSSSTLDKILNDKEFFNQNFGPNTSEILSKRIEETSLLRNNQNSNKILVQDKSNLAILKNDIHYLNEYEYRIINIVSNYLFSDCNVDYMIKNSNISYQTILNALSDKILKELLKEEYYIQIERLRNIELNINQIGINSKRELFITCVENLSKNNYNIKSTSNFLKIPYYLLKRILEQDFINILYKDDVVSKIQNALNPKKEENIKLK